MPRPGIVRALLGTLALLVATGGYWLLSRPAPSVLQVPSHVTIASYPIARTLQYSFTLKNTTRHPVLAAQLWVHAPVPLTAGQRCCRNINASRPFEAEDDELGNRVLRFDWPGIAPYATETLTVRVSLEMASTPNTIALPDTARYLRDAPLVQTQDPRVMSIARQLSGQTPLALARSAFEWTAANIQDSGYLPQDRGSLYALTERRGDCTEFMYLFMALARANGIPARGIAGYVQRNNGVLHAADFHNWAEFYLDGRWQIADPHERVFMAGTADYIAFRLLGDAAQAEVAPRHRFHFEGDGLRVTMN